MRRHNRKSNESAGQLRKRFVLRMFKNNIEGNTLGLPPKFISKYGDELSDIVKLIDPDHNVWQVDLTKGKNTFWFDGDWDKFVKYYSISEGYVLTFKYKGKYNRISHFSVAIFDESACEIQYSGNIPSNDVEKTCIYAKNGSQSVTPTPSKKSSITTETSKKNMAMPPTASGLQLSIKRRHDHSSVPEDNSSLEPECQRKKRKFNVKEEAGLTDSEEDVNDEIDDIDVALEGITTPRGFFTQYGEATLETQRAVLKACTSKPQNGCFMVILQTYNIDQCRGYMHVPAAFTRDHLQHPDKNLKLQLSNGNDYSVSIHRDNDRPGKIRLSLGWPEFSRDNDLEEGDVCLYELVPSAAGIVLNVSIFRASDFSLN